MEPQNSIALSSFCDSTLGLRREKPVIAIWENAHALTKLINTWVNAGVPCVVTSLYKYLRALALVETCSNREKEKKKNKENWLNFSCYRFFRKQISVHPLHLPHYPQSCSSLVSVAPKKVEGGGGWERKNHIHVGIQTAVFFPRLMVIQQNIMPFVRCMRLKAENIFIYLYIPLRGLYIYMYIYLLSSLSLSLSW